MPELVGWGIIWAMSERKHSFLCEVFLEAPTFHPKLKGAKGAREKPQLCESGAKGLISARPSQKYSLVFRLVSAIAGVPWGQQINVHPEPPF